MVTLDRQSEDHALLVLANGDIYDIYGNSWKEMKDDASSLALSFGMTIDMFNSEIPE